LHIFISQSTDGSDAASTTVSLPLWRKRKMKLAAADARARDRTWANWWEIQTLHADTVNVSDNKDTKPCQCVILGRHNLRNGSPSANVCSGISFQVKRNHTMKALLIPPVSPGKS
jgi:hypothetical protein